MHSRCRYCLLLPLLAELAIASPFILSVVLSENGSMLNRNSKHCCFGRAETSCDTTASQLAVTTGEVKFPECRWLSRVSKIEHSGKRIFPECCTRRRITLGEERFFRVPQRSWHSIKSSTRKRPSSPSATLGEDWHSAKKHVT